jgi:hypothetical protein
LDVCPAEVMSMRGDKTIVDEQRCGDRGICVQEHLFRETRLSPSACADCSDRWPAAARA